MSRPGDPNHPGRRVQELYGRHEGADIYVVGTGASLRVFPKDFLAGKITIGLNRAWQTVPVTYGITIHPALNIPELMDGEASRPEITWVTKHAKLDKLPDDVIARAEAEYYFFRTDGKPNTQTNGQSDAGRVQAWLRKPTDEYLYLWSSIATSGANLAANMGARNIVMVGCDNAALLGNHHAEHQHTMWLGAQPDARYRDYYLGLAEVRAELRHRGITMVSVTPFLTLGPHDEEFLSLCADLERPELLVGQDVTHVHHPPPPTLWSKVRRRVRQLR